ncbi:putative secreted protein [Saccharothrix espanaensis DSM 44229]|uniref:Putative secreted protein n=1 Tax=Saccharothrix espanaensis (strain ATCC 51144 / DSM 44229 / JCM 9112 / NBRC 15066 / NRRL 15764) TaxID=1179773 RepID=K0K2A3_SACES|nr:putative secreted protein [Saccharothrix espanaensis DSM 44229]
MLCDCDVGTTGAVVVVCSTFGSSGRGPAASGSFFAGSADAVDDFGARADTVTTTVDVLPSAATRTDVSTVGCTSARGSGGAGSGSPPRASMDARVAITVATTAPPPASSATEEAFLFGAG